MALRFRLVAKMSRCSDMVYPRYPSTRSLDRIDAWKVSRVVVNGLEMRDGQDRGKFPCLESLEPSTSFLCLHFPLQFNTSTNPFLPLHLFFSLYLIHCGRNWTGPEPPKQRVTFLRQSIPRGPSRHSEIAT